MVSPGATDTDLLRSTNSAEGLAMAARFYGDLLGWEVVTYPGGAAFRSGDVALGGASRTNPGVPPHWTGFIRVSDVDSAASAAASAGGKIGRAHV